MSTKISELIKEKKANNELFIALEFFPPKTEAGVKSLHNVMEKLKAVDPLYVDFTWGAGGSTSDLTVQLCIEAKEKFGERVTPLLVISLMNGVLTMMC